MGRAIFISYRRDDTEGEAGRLFDDLVRVYGDNSVFMDVAGINPGIDFRKAIEDNVATCGVLLAMIGPTWTTIANSAGHRRLDDANDFVRLEIGAALARDIAVIPVLVHNAKMPTPDVLPEDLKNLAYRNSVEITHERWNSDVQLLTNALQQYVSSSSYTSTEPVHATVSVQLPPPNPPEKHAAAAQGSKTPLYAVIAVLVALAAGAGIFFAVHGSHPASQASSPEAAAAPAESAPSSAAGPAAADTSAMDGTWTNTRSMERNGLAKLIVSSSGGPLTIQAWGQCAPTDCDWGQQTATVQGQQATATFGFTQGHKGQRVSRVAVVTVAPSSGGLAVTVDSTTGKKATTHNTFTFTRSE